MGKFIHWAAKKWMLTREKVTHEKIILAFMGFITLPFLFPPFESVHQYGGSSNAGYSFILHPPERYVRVPTVDVGTLMAEWVFALMLAGAAWLFVKIRDKDTPQKEDSCKK